MEHIDYFKLQAKNLHKDFKTRFFNEETKRYEYKPKFFDISSIFIDFDFPDYKDDFSFTLMNAQHLIAKIVRFDNWGKLANASEEDLRLAHRRLDISVYKLGTPFAQKYEKQLEKTFYATPHFNAYAMPVKEKLEIIKKEFMNINSDSKRKLLAAPKNLYAFMLPILAGYKITFSFDAVEYAQSYLIYSSDINDISTAKPLAAGQFSPIEYIAHHQTYVPYYWVRAFDGKEYGEWSAIARTNR